MKIEDKREIVVTLDKNDIRQAIIQHLTRHPELIENKLQINRPRGERLSSSPINLLVQFTAQDATNAFREYLKGIPTTADVPPCDIAEAVQEFSATGQFKIKIPIPQ